MTIRQYNYIAVYHVPRDQMYYFVPANTDTAESRRDLFGTEGALVTHIRLSPPHQQELSEKMRADGKVLGWIAYRLQGDTFTATDYQPKHALMGDRPSPDNRALGGLGKVLEDACLAHQASTGRANTQATIDAKTSRKGQITKCGLPIGHPVAITEWRMALQRNFPPGYPRPLLET